MSDCPFSIRDHFRDHFLTGGCYVQGGAKGVQVVVKQVRVGVQCRRCRGVAQHPLAWLLSATGTTGLPLVVPTGLGVNNTGSQLAFEGQVGTVLSLPVYTDPSLPTNVGVGTNEAIILMMKADDHWLYESSIRTRTLPEVGSGTLTVRQQITATSRSPRPDSQPPPSS